VKAQVLPVVEFTFRSLLPIWKQDTDADPQNPNTEHDTLKAVHNSYYPAGGIAVQSNEGNRCNRAITPKTYQKRPGASRGVSVAEPKRLEQVPQELVVDLVVELHF